MPQASPAFHVYRYRVRPLRPNQEALAFQALGNSRWAYNQIVSLNRQRLDDKQKVLSKVEAINLLPRWKQEHDWLGLGPSQPLQQSIIDYWQGLQAFFDAPVLNRPPAYKKKFDDSASLRFPQPKPADWNAAKGWVNLPKLGQLKYFKDPGVPHGTLKQVQLVREGERWFVCLCVEQSGKKARARAAKQKIHALPSDPRDLQDSDITGLDFGHVHALTDHLGRHYDFPVERIEKLQLKIERLKAVVVHKRKAARAWKKHLKLTERVQDSNQLKRSRRALRNAQTQLNDLLRDTRHQLSHRLTDFSPILGVEDLKLKKLLENIERAGPATSTPTEFIHEISPAGVHPSAQGKPIVSATERFKPSSKASNPMPRAKEKALHRGWARLGAGIILNQMEYKAKRKGGLVVRVNPAYTSQTCPSCQHIDKANRESQAVFRCKACGFSGHADQVGAINVRTRAMEELIRDGFPQPKPPKHKRPRNPRKPKATKETTGALAPA